jgi:hypothetical protein
LEQSGNNLRVQWVNCQAQNHDSTLPILKADLLRHETSVAPL